MLRLYIDSLTEKCLWEDHMSISKTARSKYIYNTKVIEITSVTNNYM